MTKQTLEIIGRKEAQRPKTRTVSMDLNQLKALIRHEINVAVAQGCLKRYKQIRKSVVNAWYGSYGPKYYHRTRSLYYFAYPYVEGEDFWVDYGTEHYYAHHRASPEVIYANSFQQGWHGGAIGGPGHPSPGTPYYRTPPPDYSFWGKEAVPGFSIEDALWSEWDAFCNSSEGQAMVINAIEQVLLKYRDIILAFIRAMLNQ